MLDGLPRHPQPQGKLPSDLPTGRREAGRNRGEKSCHYSVELRGVFVNLSLLGPIIHGVFWGFDGNGQHQRPGSRGSGMTAIELLVGTKRIRPKKITEIKGGLQAELQGEALLSLLDAGLCPIEALGGSVDRCRFEVSAIEMRGASTRVTLVQLSAPGLVH